MEDEAEGKDDGLEKMIQHMTEIYPMFLKPLDEEVEEQHELNKVAYRREEDGWTCVRSVVDSGAQANVAPRDMVPGWEVRPSEGSRQGREFVTAGGGTLKNQGEQMVPMRSGEGVWTETRWQIAPVTRPLLSVGEECDANKLVILAKTGGAILSLETGSVRRFPRKNGAYEIEMWVPPPPGRGVDAGFPRQGS